MKEIIDKLDFIPFIEWDEGKMKLVCEEEKKSMIRAFLPEGSIVATQWTTMIKVKF